MDYGYFDLRPIMFQRKVDKFLTIQREIEQSKTDGIKRPVRTLNYENISRTDM